MNMPNSSVKNQFSFDVEGMTCASCVARVEKELKKVENIEQATVNLATEKVTVVSSKPIATQAVVQAVEKAGYAVPVKTIELKI